MPLLASSRRRITLIASALALGTAAAALPALTAAADAAVIPRSALPAVRYVALGDSYSSGVGSGDYYRSGGSCERSPGAYPALWAAASHPASYVSEACSGATIGSALRSQLSVARSMFSGPSGTATPASGRARSATNSAARASRSASTRRAA